MKPPIDLHLEIPDSEVVQDIADTLKEIRSLQWQVEVATEGIAKRRAFVEKLVILQQARKEAAAEGELEEALAETAHA